MMRRCLRRRDDEVGKIVCVIVKTYCSYFFVQAVGFVRYAMAAAQRGALVSMALSIS